MRRFLGTVGDRPVVKIDQECLSLYKRWLAEAKLSPATRAAMIGCLRSFLKFVRDVKGLAVYDAEKIQAPRIPSRTVEFLTKDEVQWLFECIPTRKLSGLRDRALAVVLCSTGMRISEVLARPTFLTATMPLPERVPQLGPQEIRGEELVVTGSPLDGCFSPLYLGQRPNHVREARGMRPTHAGPSFREAHWRSQSSSRTSIQPLHRSTSSPHRNRSRLRA